jgi:putative acetyltransferase
MIEIRKENQEDRDPVRTINDMAFDQPTEGKIVDKIRSACTETISLVAVKEGQVVGHIFFSPVSVNYEGKEIMGMGLAPMAVKPEFQKQGIGSLLVNEGIKILKKYRCPFVVVLGHDKFYPRFGFKVASEYGLVPQWQGVPDEAFMVLFLNKSALGKVSGVVSYRNEFNEAM